MHATRSERFITERSRLNWTARSREENYGLGCLESFSAQGSVQTPAANLRHQASVEVLAKHGNDPVVVRKQNVMAATFQLSDDTRVHAEF